MAEHAHSLPPSWDPSIPPRPLRPPDVSPPPSRVTRAVVDGVAGDGAAATNDEHRRLLVGNLVVRRLTYRSVARVAWPFFAALYAIALAAGVLAWNVAALLGWSPGADGVDIAWADLAASVVAVPVLVLLALGLAALYNAVSERSGGVEIAVVSPRRYRQADGGR